MSNRDWPNLLAMFNEQMGNGPDAPFLWAKEDGAFAPLSRRQTAQGVASLAKGLVELGVQSKDRIVLVSENRPRWLIADLAILAAGAITTPAYTTNMPEDHLHILTDSGAKGAIISTPKLLEKFLPAALQAPNLEFIITMEPAALKQSPGATILSWDEACRAEPEPFAWLQDPAQRLKREDLACIIYTSGTGGLPKGVMTTHGAILHNCAGALDALHEIGLGAETFLSFLPLSHAYEHTTGQFFPLSIGAQIYYCIGADQLVSDMAAARPTIMTAVPRLYETLHARILRGVEKAGGSKKKLFDAALELGRKRQAKGGFSIGDAVKNKVLDLSVRRKVRKTFGGRLKAMVSGGGPLNPDIGAFFDALGLRILQGYGLTESGPVVSVNRPSKVKFHTVGPALPDTEVRLAEDGEIMIKGELVMKGYWRDEKATARCLQDGWLATGDVGMIDEDGYISITDRKKDIIVNSGGDNVAPQRVEGHLICAPELAQAMVYGDRHPHLVALLVPDPDWLGDWAGALGKPRESGQLTNDKDLIKALSEAVSRVNTQLSTIEKVRKFILADEPFSVDNGQLTPTLKVRRHKVRDVYGERLEGLYR